MLIGQWDVIRTYLTLAHQKRSNHCKWLRSTHFLSAEQRMQVPDVYVAINA